MGSFVRSDGMLPVYLVRDVPGLYDPSGRPVPLSLFL